MKLWPSIRCLSALASGAVIFGGWGATSAVAHGPCRCLDPVLTQPGDKVRIEPENGQVGMPGVPAYRVVFNPRPSDFGIAPSYLASVYRADAPTTTVLSRSRHEPTRRGRFRIPTGTPPGLYMVLIWDGGEGGSHNTWDYLHVTDWDESDALGVVAEHGERSPDETNASGRAVSTASDQTNQTEAHWPLLAGTVLGAVAVGMAGGIALARRGR